MKRSEILALLVRARAVDPRGDTGDAVVGAWDEVLRGDRWLTYELAAEALRGYYHDEAARRVMPADIVGRAWDIRLQRIAVTRMPDPPQELAGNPGAYTAAIEAARDAAAAGRDPAAAMQAVADQLRRELADEQ